MADLFENPIGTDGFEFVEFTDMGPEVLGRFFETFGFTAVAKHKSKNVLRYCQGDINFLLNCEPGGQPGEFRAVHSQGANGMAFRVKDADAAFAEAVRRGGEPISVDTSFKVPAIQGIGGTHLYFVDRAGAEAMYADFVPLPGADEAKNSAALTYLDHLTHNLYRGHMKKWADFYERIFNFREIRYFDIEGKQTGLVSKAMTSPCGKIRIPLNESRDDHSQIEEFLRDYNGEGIQHIALGTDDIYDSVEALRARAVAFQSTPDTYYAALGERVKGHEEDFARLRKNAILLDGAPTEGQGLLLQIFTQNAIGPIFFEIIQRKGNEGFGEGNFKALFESIEEDQVRRGVLKASA